MQSFITLLDENQLTKDEQKQVFESIKNDYENLAKNYEDAKQNDANDLMRNDLDMDK